MDRNFHLAFDVARLRGKELSRVAAIKQVSATKHKSVSTVEKAYDKYKQDAEIMLERESRVKFRGT